MKAQYNTQPKDGILSKFVVVFQNTVGVKQMVFKETEEQVLNMVSPGQTILNVFQLSEKGNTVTYEIKFLHGKLCLVMLDYSGRDITELGGDPTRYANPAY